MYKTESNSLVFVVFGSTGDLARTKLFPALFDLYFRKLLPNNFHIIGHGRRPYTNELFQSYVRAVLMAHTGGKQENKIDKFLRSIEYQQGTFDDVEDYKKLKQRLEKISVGRKKYNNRIFHLAVPPEHVKIIISRMKQVGLSGQPNDGTWTRVLVEKPFGNDTKTAQELDYFLGKVFSEKQIFRIDHYLAKEALQNILTFRFSNDLFESLWDKKHIESVQIYFRQAMDVGTRGDFYDSVGALRDVGQNHMLQMLTAIAMENPTELNDKSIRKAREKILNSLQIPTREDVVNHMSRGQYQGFRNTKGVAKNSKTETFFAVRAFIKNKRWAGVPFYLEGGKALLKDRIKIRINFKATESCLCPPNEKDHNHYNSLVFQVRPEEGISVQFWSKAPGFSTKLEPRLLSFVYENDDNNKIHIPDAYERVIYDCIRGDQTLFASTAEVKASWRYITPIVENWDGVPLQIYRKDSKGPEIRFPDKLKRVYYH